MTIGRLIVPFAIFFLFWAAPAFGASPTADAKIDIRLDTPSGYPVPRFVSLKSRETYCRAGPTFSHPIKITYVRSGLPVLVIAETSDHWRKVRDAENDECWIHKSKLTGAPTALVLRDRLPIRARPNFAAPAKAHLGGGVITKVSKVRDSWFFVSAHGVKGWAPANALWGGDLSTVFSAPRN